MPTTIFLTGATGLLGSYLLKIFLANGHKVYAFARSKEGKTAQERTRKAVTFWDPQAKFNNCIVFEGDITKPYLGLDAKSQELLRTEAEEIFHCAAVTNLKWPLEEIREVNVEGTRNILQLAANLAKNGRLKKTNHISTAFVYGDYKAEFRETDLDVGQSFKTTYEHTFSKDDLFYDNVITEAMTRFFTDLEKNCKLIFDDVVVTNTETGKSFKIAPLNVVVKIE